MLLKSDEEYEAMRRASARAATPPESPPSSPPKANTRWRDGHGASRSRASGRGHKADETARTLAHMHERPVYALDENDPNCDE
jgi:hypothetical protein|tara:strand:- start:2648 stop:2896 length:249 start_codon:yes stop_codon:yes gene_type:complete